MECPIQTDFAFSFLYSSHEKVTKANYMHFVTTCVKFSRNVLILYILFPTLIHVNFIKNLVL